VKLKIIKKVVRWYGISQIKKNGFWFVDIPRTSSTSIKVQLARKYGRTYGKRNLYNLTNHTKGIFGDHLTSKQMVNILGQEVWDNLFTFTIVRNPWDRAVSMYNYWLKNVYPKETSISFKDHILLLKTKYKNDKLLINECYEYISNNNKIIVDKVIRFENREEELQKISEKLGCGDLTKEHYEKTLGQETYREFYDNETRRIIEEVCAKDIEEFGYSFE